MDKQSKQAFLLALMAIEVLYDEKLINKETYLSIMSNTKKANYN